MESERFRENRVQLALSIDGFYAVRPVRRPVRPVRDRDWSHETKVPTRNWLEPSLWRQLELYNWLGLGYGVKCIVMPMPMESFWGPNPSEGSFRR